MTTYGSSIGISPYRTESDVIGSVETSGVGNVILRCGHTYPANHEAAGSWTQTLHIVLTPEEARALVDEITEALGR